MPSRVQSAPVIGLPQIRGWSQVVINAAKDLACSFAIEGDNANNHGRDFVAKFSDLEISSASELHQHLLDSLAHLRRANCKLHIACCYVKETKIVLATYNGIIILNRGTKTGDILTSSDNLNIIEGRISPEDTFVLATKQTEQFMGEVKQHLTAQLDTDTIITSLVTKIHGLDNSSLSAVSFISLEKEVVEIVEEVIVTPEPPTTIIETAPEIPPVPASEPQPPLQPEIDPEMEEITQRIVTQQETTPNTITDSNLTPTSAPKTKPAGTKAISSMKNALGKMGSSAKNIPSSLKKHLPSKDTYVGRQPNKKTIRIIFGVIIALIVIGGLIFWRQSNINQAKAQIQEQISPIISQVDEARSQIDSDPFTARENVSGAIKELEQLANENENNKTASKIITQELANTQAFYEEISGRDEFSDLSVFFDLRLVESDFNTNQSDLYGTNAYFLDTGTNKIIALDLEQKQSKSVPIDTEAQFKDLATGEDALYLLGDGIHSIETNDFESFKTLKEEGESDGAGTLLSTFGPYLYVFNPEKRNIYRYLATEDELSSPIGWLISKQGVEFDAVRTMEIDGDVWIGTDTGDVKKFTRGTEEDFPISGMEEPFSTPVSVFTKEDLENIYVLEPEKNRIIILTKDGKFMREIQSESLASATHILANEEMNKVFAISGSIVFEIPL